MSDQLSSILKQIKDLNVVLFEKANLSAFFKQQAQGLREEGISALFNDLFAFNAYLGRIEGYPSFEKIPFWEYSLCLEWSESHMMFGTSFDLTLKDAKRFLGSIKEYYGFLIAEGKMKASAELDRALKEICGGRKLRLVKDIPYTGEETYTEFIIGGAAIRFDIADYWLIILLGTLFDGNWTRLLEAAFGVSPRRVEKVKSLQDRTSRASLGKPGELIYSDVTKAEADRAESWFYSSP
jgi:hypothetical protein